MPCWLVVVARRLYLARHLFTLLCNKIDDNIMVRLLLNSVTILVEERVTRQTVTVATQDAHWTGPLYHKE